MSTITNTHRKAHHRCKLLATVSAAALLGLIHGAAIADAADADRPLLWIELGGQFDRVSGQPQPYLPPFANVAIQHGLISPASLQAPQKFSLGEEGRISFQPDDSDWIFSASIRYGRSGGKGHKHQELEVPGVYLSSHQTSFQPHGPNNQGPILRTADYTAKSSERHAILDFQAAKDVGLGMLGHGGTAQLAFGVRIAQFSTKSNLNLLADPDPHTGDKYFPSRHRSFPIIQYYQFYKAKPEILRNFRGVGPALSWNGSMAVVGSESADAEVTFDWGVNVAALFGRQKVRIQHQTTSDKHKNNPFGPLNGEPKYTVDHYVNSAHTVRSRSVFVPNAGALIGASLKFPNVKVSIGYRADFFFGALDGGIDTRQSVTRGFSGPFASLSVGLGD